ncbi:MAG: feruloyl-CoA synthase [Proteobacteria bacterium]|nr:feruloyl-CoA synthase [Pseudomonadota bacterium]
MSDESSSPDFAAVRLAEPRPDVQHRPDGAVLISCTDPLRDYPRQLGEHLKHWAKIAPDRTFLAERAPDGDWRRLSYSAAAELSNRVSQWLLDRGHSAKRPIAALSDNSINMALLKLGAMQIGIPFLPVSPAYSLMSENFAKLKYIAGEFSPSLIYVSAFAPFARALAAIRMAGMDLLADHCDPAFPHAVVFTDVLKATATDLVREHYGRVGPDTIAKILLTSGSTGMPKGVINTQRMMGANGAAIDHVWPFLSEKPPIIVDWLPWNHTFGTNFNFNQILRNGGTMYIDAGKPVPGKLELTLANIREIQPTLFFNVPRGFDMVIPALEQDDGFARHVFEKLDIIFYAGAALPPHLWKRLDALSVKHRAKRIPILSSLGSTETAPVATFCHWPAADIGGVGLPVPGTTVKLVPDGEKLEMRVKGENVTPGYYGRPDLTEKAFDDEGFFKLGDAVAFVDPADPRRGLRFDGRVSENFKLSSGTWVQVGDLRLSFISAAAPVVQDAVVTGHDREDVGLLLFLSQAGCQQICRDKQARIDRLVGREEIRSYLLAALEAFNKSNAGNSRRIARLLVMTEPPSIDGNEITDKGYINQRAVLERRAELVERLYSDDTSPDVMTAPARRNQDKSSVPAMAAQN